MRRPIEEEYNAAVKAGQATLNQLHTVLMDNRALRDKLEKLQEVVEAAQNFLASDGDYFNWTEDERHCLSRLKEALLALEEEV